MARKKKIKELSNYEISLLCRELSILLNAGIAPAEGIEILMQGLDDSGREVLESISHVLNAGEKFHIAIQMSGVFPDYVAHMISIGEESGSLDVVMDSLADYYEQEDNIQNSIKSAVSYPMIMIGLMMVVILVLVTQVLPIFNQVFSQLGTSMSAFAQTLLNLGSTLNKYSFFLITILIIIAVLFIFFTQTIIGKKKFRAFASNWKVTRKLYNDIATERFASGMVLTLSSGLDTYESLNLVTTLVENRAMSQKINDCRELIMQGLSFPEAIEKAEIFNPFYSKMIAVGFNSGSIDEVMKQIATRYREETQRRIYRSIAILEPTLVIALSVIVGIVLLSVILPLLGIMSSIG